MISIWSLKPKTVIFLEETFHNLPHAQTNCRAIAAPDGTEPQEWADYRVHTAHPKEVHLGQHHAPHLIDNPHQVTSSPIEAALLRQDRKLIPMCLHMTE